MSDVMRPQSFEVLLDWLLREYKARGEMFGIPGELFWRPGPEAPYATRMFGEELGTPIGPAAGPQTQMAQNIVSAWLCGGRFVELKTVQIRDELDIPRPCIDAADEGYNVEWSQELRLDQSAREYIHAWALIHVLRRVLGWEDYPLGTVFNMSVGYDLAGITSPSMQRFMARMMDAREEIAELREILRERHPELAEVDIPARITKSVTLSTMHGCPPNEIEAIANHLLEKGLHTFVKLNPTLLGKDRVMRILHDHLGFRGIEIPDAVFDHDLQYEQALPLIRRLKEQARKLGLTFGVKLTNTLAMANHRGTLPGEEIYMSGRALYPIAMNLFLRLSEDLDGDLDVSYCGGADALNLPTILACGAKPVTAVTDLLKPGGYGRFHQWLSELKAAMERVGARDLAEFAAARRENLRKAAEEALEAPRYKRSYFLGELPKIPDGLGLFDCIAAPCVAACPVLQDVPEYVGLVEEGMVDQALEAILARNPMPMVTGYVCPAFCQRRCTRWNYEKPVAIRALKRFAAEGGAWQPRLQEVTGHRVAGHRVAVVGAGPAGLSAAFYLALAGVEVTIFEASSQAGGMISWAPGFRLPREALESDIRRIAALGVEFRFCSEIRSPWDLLSQGYEAVFLAPGFPGEAQLGIPGEEGPGVYGALAFLRALAEGRAPDLGEKAVVVGGGNTAMDAARAAWRLTGKPVTVVYRRSRAEMPAHPEEVEELLLEGNELLELASPLRVLRKKGKVVGILCVRNALTEPGPDGRPKPVPIPGSEFRLWADSLIVAIGQRPAPLLGGSPLLFREDGRLMVDPETGETNLFRLYAGGDTVRGPATVIEALSDGRRAAASILRRLGIPFPNFPIPQMAQEASLLRVRKAQKLLPLGPKTLEPGARRNFSVVELPLGPKAENEAQRCLQCRTLCDKCVEVCPNRANLPYLIRTGTYAVPVLALTSSGGGIGGVEARLGSEGAQLQVVAKEEVVIRQARQILHLDDFCNACGNCATFCVHQGQPFRDKPRLFFSREAFAAEDSNAFFLEGKRLLRREEGKEMSLELEPDGFLFEDEEIRVRLDRSLNMVVAELRRAFSGVRSLRPAWEMALIFEGITHSLPHLLEAGHG